MNGAASGEYRRVLRLALPIILSNVSVPLLGAVDTAVVGHLPGPQYLGSVAIGATVFSFLYWGFGFLRMATTGFVAQAVGRRDGDELRAAIARALVIGFAVSLALIAFQAPIGWAAFALFEASREVEELARIYFDVRIWGAPATLANYACLGALLGMQRVKAALLLQLWMNGLNIALDLLFVPVLGWGVWGVALATVIAEYAAVAVGLALVARGVRPIAGRLTRNQVLAPERLSGTLAVNRDIFIRTVCLIAAFALFTAEGARMGDLTLAANAVLMNFQTFMAYALDGFAQAAEALIGAAVGSRDRAAFRAAVRASTVWATVLAVAFAATYALAGAVLIGVLTGLPEVRALALAFLPWAALSPAISIWSFQLDGIFLGATRGRDLRNAMLVSLAVYVAAVATLVPPLGNYGLWLAFFVFMATRAVTLALRYPALVRSLAGSPGIA